VDSEATKALDRRKARGGRARSLAFGLAAVVAVAAAFRLYANHYFDLDHKGRMARLHRREPTALVASATASPLFHRPPWKTISPEAHSRLESTIRDLAPKAGLRVGRIAIDDDAIWVEVCR
jgi:hypothetical protein